MSRLQLFFLLICLPAIFFSCRKDWTCSCKMLTGGETIVIIKSAKKAEAEEVCELRAEKPIEGEQLTRCVLEGKYKEYKD